jgi:hypothetical protein
VYNIMSTDNYKNIYKLLENTSRPGNKYNIKKLPPKARYKYNKTQRKRSTVEGVQRYMYNKTRRKQRTAEDVRRYRQQQQIQKRRYAQLYKDDMDLDIDYELFEKVSGYKPECICVKLNPKKRQIVNIIDTTLISIRNDTSIEQDIINACNLQNAIFSIEHNIDVGYLDEEAYPKLNSMNNVYSMLNAYGNFIEAIPGKQHDEMYITYVKFAGQIASSVLIAVKEINNKLTFQLSSFATNPAFLKMNFAKLLLLYVYRFVSTYASSSIYSIALVVSTSQFPFINFYNRLLFYLNMKFSPTPYDIDNSIVHIINNEGTEYHVNLYDIQEFKKDVFNSATIKNKIQLLYPDKQKGNNIIVEITNETIQQYITLFENMYSEISSKYYTNVPMISSRALYNNNYLLISHSGYEIDRDKRYFKSARVPDNYEIIIINTPGSYKYVDQILNCDVAFIKNYLNKLPLHIIQSFFPPFRADKTENKIPSIFYNTTTNAKINTNKQWMSYSDSTSSGIMIINNIKNEVGSQVQIHAYKSGDTYPDLQLEYSGGLDSNDIVYLYAGLYDTNSEHFNIIYPEMPGYDDAIHEIHNSKIHIFSKTNMNMQITDRKPSLNKYVHQIINRKSLLYDGFDSSLINIPGAEVKKSYISEYLARMQTELANVKKPEPGKTTNRIYIISCGNVIYDTPLEKNIDLQIRDIATYKSSKIIYTNELDGYCNTLYTIGTSILHSLSDYLHIIPDKYRDIPFPYTSRIQNNFINYTNYNSNQYIQAGGYTLYRRKTHHKRKNRRI